MAMTTPRRTVERVLLGGAVLAACLAAAVPLVPDSVPLAVRVVAGVAVAAVAVAVTELRAGHERRTAASADLARHARHLVDGRRLPLVRELRDPQTLGVASTAAGRSTTGLAYVPRTRDAELDRALRDGRFVLVTGDSKAGKTRSAFEALRRCLPDRPLVTPARPDSLAALLAADLVPDDAVVWLDDLERHLTPDGLTEHTLDRLTDAGTHTVVVATMRSTQLDHLAPRLDDERGEVEDPAWRMLTRATQVRFERLLDDAERRSVGRQVDDDDLRRALERFGLAEYIVAGPDLVGRFVHNLATQPVGTAVVRAAVAWRVAGLARPTPLPVLRRLCADLLAADGAPLSPEEFDRGLGWARQRIYAASALLTVSDDAATVYDYAADEIERDHLPELPPAVWRHLLRAATRVPGEALTVGQRAFAHGRVDVAADAGRVVASAGGDLAGVGRRLLGWALEEQGDLDGAAGAYRDAAAAPDPDLATAALIDLGLLHEAQGGYDEAAAAYERAADGAPRLRPLVFVNLGRVRWRQGDLAAARRCYGRTAAAADPEQAARATRFLGYLLEGQGDVSGARDAFERTIATGDDIQAPKAMVALGDLLTHAGDIAGARAAYGQAIASDDADLSTAGALYLGALLAGTGEPVHARRTFDELLDRLGPDALTVVRDQFELTGVLYGADRTRTVLAQVVASAHPDLAPLAHRLLTEVTAGDADATRAHVRSPRRRVTAGVRRGVRTSPPPR